MSSQEIDRQAAEWAAKTDAGRLDPDAQAAFDAWLAADVRHVGAYARATAVLAHLEHARAVGPDFGTLRPESAPFASRRYVVLGGGIAASLAALGVAGDVAWRVFGAESYSTGLGETEVVALQDGSIVTLNTDSRVVVHYTKARRDIVLERGEALFDVAKNKKRPFIVHAGNTEVRAVGTSFTVQMVPGGPVQVLVREGVVEVRHPDVPVAAPVRVSANTRAVAPADAPIAAAAVAPAEVARALAWRIGRIAFDDETLADAAVEFARYSATRIVIDDPAVARQTVTGLYVSNDPVGFARAVALSLDLHAEVGDHEVHISR